MESVRQRRLFLAVPSSTASQHNELVDTEWNVGQKQKIGVASSPVVVFVVLLGGTIDEVS